MGYSFGKKLCSLVRISLCGILTGVFTALVILLYKVLAGVVIETSKTGYTYIREHLYILPLVLLGVFLIAIAVAYIYKKWPDIQGGGIPTSIGIMRGFIFFKWIRNLLGTFLMSLLTFLVGVPLGNEGPAVQMGTAVGRGVVSAMPKSQRGLDRYSMMGGACAGFSSATGAPISGILFAIEEVSGRFSPLVLLVCAVSVLSARAVMELLAPIFNVSVTLFPIIDTVVLPVRDLWLPAILGVIMGLFSVMFLKYYDLLHKAFKKVSKRCRHSVLIFIIYALTILAGICSFSFVSTGHEVILELFENNLMFPLLLILFVRTTLGLGANTAGITGGIFVPILTLGALVSAIVCSVLKFTIGLSDSYCLLLLLLGICACIAGTMKMPLTAMTFAVEALSCYTNLLSVITVAITAFAITELFSAHSINEYVLERKLKKLYDKTPPKVCSKYVTVAPNSFVEGRRICDVLWPADMLILSAQKSKESVVKTGQVDNLVLGAGNILHIQYSTVDEKETESQLITLVGKQ